MDLYLETRENAVKSASNMGVEVSPGGVLKQHLEALGLLTVEEYQAASQMACERKKGWFRCLLELGEDKALVRAQAAAEFLGLEWWDLGGWKFEDIVQEVVDTKFIAQHQVLPLVVSAEVLWVAISDPMQLEIIPEIKFHTDLQVKTVVVEHQRLQQWIHQYLSHFQYQEMNGFQAEKNSFENDAQVSDFVQKILLDAHQKKASDIHLEPHKTSYRLRFRIDGILHKISQISSEVALRITTRLKVISKLDIAERRLPQDGRFHFPIDSQKYKDCRISTCPTLYGEKTVIRLLEAEKSFLQISQLGMEASQQEAFEKAIIRPQGMILVTGPTGSGKTLTLYTALSMLNTLERNIVTVEDPIEMQLLGINQVAVHPKIQLDFAKVLRAFLRQDPDVIMIGEIRDAETAEIAIKAAQTGHLVFSTLHTNSTIEAILRLQAMGISPFNMVHSLHLIVAQRLLRKLCVHCKRQDENSGIWAASGCAYCMQGYQGRTAVFEFLNIDSEISQKILQNETASEIKKTLKSQGWLDLQAAALCKINAGITSLAEVNRVLI